MENLNGFMAKNNLVLNIKDKYKCQICNGVLVKAVSSICLCSFCQNCIVKYLNGGNKPCPGCLKKNQNSIINYSTDISKNFQFDEKIKSLKYKCVFTNCNEEIEIENMLGHIQQCTFSDALCSGEENARGMMMNVGNEVNSTMMKVAQLEKEKSCFKKEIVRIRNDKARDNEEMRKKMEENEKKTNIMIEKLNKKIEEMELSKKKETETKKFEMKNNAPIRDDKINQHSFTFTNMSRIKKGKVHESPPFQLSNYEFLFRIIYHKNGGIVIGLVLLASSNESSEEWPIKKKFILELIKNEATIERCEFDRNSSPHKGLFEKVELDCKFMWDSGILTRDKDAIFDDELKLRLSLN